jgi:very-short-patch-repair endonuclease
LTTIARTLRRKQTEEERKLWTRLRDRRLNAFKFRRQAPCGPFVADFLCEAARLIVEVDGSQHAEDENMRADEGRTRMLNPLGYEVLRVWNVDVKKNMAGVLDSIVARVSHRIEDPSSALRAPPPVGEKDTPTELRDQQ